jgi:hypothetical protein
MLDGYRVSRTDDRNHQVAVGSDSHVIHLTNDQKQYVSFVVCPDVPDFEQSVSSKVIFATPIGRLVLDSNVVLAPEAFEQIKDFDYSFFRHTDKSPTTVVLPPTVDRIGLEVFSDDKGRTWSVNNLTLFHD